MKNAITLVLSPTFKKKTYKILRQEKHFFQGIHSENAIEIIVIVEFLKQLSNGNNQFRVIQKEYQQSNQKGMYAWAKAMSPIHKEFIVNIDKNGMLTEIVNHDLITITWGELKYDLKKKFRKSDYKNQMIIGINNVLKNKILFHELMKDHYVFMLLFPTIYNECLKKEGDLKTQKTLHNFIGSRKVPIITKNKLKAVDTENNTVEIEAIGEVDNKTFRQDQVTSMIKMLKNRPRVPTTLRFNHTERYLLDKDHSPIQAMMLSLLRIPGTLYREEKTMIKQIDEI